MINDLFDLLNSRLFFNRKWACLLKANNNNNNEKKILKVVKNCKQYCIENSVKDDDATTETKVVAHQET